MNDCITIFRQILQLLPKNNLAKSIEKHAADRYVKKFSTRHLLFTLLYAHISKKVSLRDIETGMAMHQKKLYHLGMSKVTRSNLSYACKHRDYRVFEDFFYKLLKTCIGKSRSQEFQFNNPIYALDSTTIDLCLSLFPWAKYRQKKGAIKLHFQYDLRESLPVFMTLSDGKKHDISAARQADLKLSPDSILVIDRGYIDLGWLRQLDSQGVFFVTRLKKNMRYRLIGQHSQNDSRLILGDEEIEMDIEKSRKKYPDKLRLVTFYDEKNDKVLQFLTNNFKFAASTIAKIYKLRWEIEKFFRWIKQNLKITTFFGTSKNAVLLQIWAAMIYYLLLHFIEFQTKIAWGIQELSRRIRATLLENRSLLDLLSDNFTSSKKPDSGAEQMTLF